MPNRSSKRRPADLNRLAAFIKDLSDRLASQVHLTTDGHKMYLTAVEEVFGGEIDFAQLIKHYGSEPEHETRYSPAEYAGSEKRVISGKPDPYAINTSYVLLDGPRKL